MSKLVQTQGPVGPVYRTRSIEIHTKDFRCVVAECRTVENGLLPSEVEANGRLLAAAYNAFDSAATHLGVNAVELAERMQDGELAALIGALERLCLDYGTFLGIDGKTPIPFNEPPDTAIAEARSILANVKGSAA